jgi:hypothetical protein
LPARRKIVKPGFDFSPGRTVFPVHLRRPALKNGRSKI